MNPIAWAAGLNGLLLETSVVVAVLVLASGFAGWLLRGFSDRRNP